MAGPIFGMPMGGRGLGPRGSPFYRYNAEERERERERGYKGRK